MELQEKSLRKLIRKFLFEIESNNLRQYYHCSNNKFNEFNLNDNKTYKEFDLPTWHFTENIDYAKKFGKYLYTVTLNINNTFDTSIPKHYKLFIDFLKTQNYSKEEFDNILDERFYNGLPYWTNEDAYYSAMDNNFDSIIIQEELAEEIISTAVFNKDVIKILKIEDWTL